MFSSESQSQTFGQKWRLFAGVWLLLLLLLLVLLVIIFAGSWGWRFIIDIGVLTTVILCILRLNSLVENQMRYIINILTYFAQKAIFKANYKLFYWLVCTKICLDFLVQCTKKKSVTFHAFS